MTILRCNVLLFVLATVVSAEELSFEANHYGITPLAVACLEGRLESVSELLRQGADPNAKLPGNESALHWSARQGNASIIERLIAAGADINRPTKGGQTALMWAAAEGNSAAVEQLLDAGADLQTRLDSGFDAMMFAVRGGHVAVVRQLLDAGVEVNAVMQPKRTGDRGPREGTSALMLAVENAHFDLAIMLVEEGADPNDERSGLTPLHVIASVRKSGRGDNPQGDPPPRPSGAKTSLQFVRDLVAKGADVQQKLRRGKGGRAQLSLRDATPILMAARTADLELLNLLIELGGDPLVANHDETTPLLAAAGVGVQAVDEEPGTEAEVLATVERLVELGADVNAVDTHGETVMHGAAYRSYPAVATWFHQHGARSEVWNHKNDWGWTPIRIGEGYRPGSFKPNPEMIAALQAAMD